MHVRRLFSRVFESYCWVNDVPFFLAFCVCDYVHLPTLTRYKYFLVNDPPMFTESICYLCPDIVVTVDDKEVAVLADA